MLNLIIHEIVSRRNAILGWGIGLTLFSLMYITVYPQVQEQMAGFADIAIYEAMGVEVASFEGYVASSVIGFFPILLGVYAIMTSTTALAGEEDDGTLEMLLTTRLKRWQIVTAKAIALEFVVIIVLVIAAFGAMMGFNMVKDQIANLSAEGIDVFFVVLSCIPLVLAFLMLGLFLGALLPSRRMALMVGLVVLILSYFGENLGGMLEELEVLKPFSLFSYFDSSSAVFVDGVAAGDVAVLLGLAVLFFGLAVVSFQRRDVTVGNWPWQRVRLSS